ncbi:peptidoglycan DD-metalloendopeptidase family protein [Cupriavidus basilensis]|uniref:Peptidoglycan DD-metalloendopeptidase family protein n=1 Tax=Cupriavidus basilensis TaxID=68895 RepID=A0ABT6AJ28_9BURK|nr:peptidoglycan DD-metalloendopeptidase family protein [Cupriavidus basilensis]MDF3832613.1 peptidoglycan DD-metalloendopeptidase family protein [Cupriavidus basilensis]
MKQSNQDTTATRRRALGLLAALAGAMLAAGCGTMASEPAPDGYYRVQSGDTLYTVARRHKRTVRDLVRWNQLPSADRIEVGQLLRVRPPAGGSAGASAGSSTGNGPVAVGDTPRVDNSGPSRAPATSIRLQWPADGRVTAGYGPPASKGLRISTAPGSAVRAAAAGKAIHVGNLRGYGMLVIIKHDDNWLTVYGNLDKPSISEGAQVAGGQEVGRMGTADSELHFEVRNNGKPVDPAGLLPARG